MKVRGKRQHSEVPADHPPHVEVLQRRQDVVEDGLHFDLRQAPCLRRAVVLPCTPLEDTSQHSERRHENYDHWKVHQVCENSRSIERPPMLRRARDFGLRADQQLRRAAPRTFRMVLREMGSSCITSMQPT